MTKIHFDKLYIIDPTGDQYDGMKHGNIEFIKEREKIVPPDQLPKDIKKFMISDDVRAKEPIINEYFCRGWHNNCNMIYLNQNPLTIDRQNVRENCNVFFYLNKEVMSSNLYIKIFFIMLK